MFKQYFKIAWRSLQKNKLYTTVNIAGLTIGMTSCILIGLYIAREYSFDRFHTKGDRIARIIMHFGDEDGRSHEIATTGTKVGPQLGRSFPSINAYTRTIKYDGLVSYDQKRFKENNILFADSSFFNIFSFPLIKGDPATALNGPNQVVITRSLAKKYFPNEDPIGKNINVFDSRQYKITGIAEDAPENSQIRFSMVVSFSSHRASKTEEWHTANYVTYLLLDRPGTLPALQHQIDAYMNTDAIRRETGVTGKEFFSFALEPLTRVHLHAKQDGLEPNGNILYIYILTAIAALILIIACVNYTNLATAQSASRKGEISIRKVLGAGKGQLLRQHLGESLLLTFISLVLSLFASIQLLPVFNRLANTGLTTSAILSPLPIAGIFSFAILVGLMAGAYPAFILAQTKLMELLRAGFRSARSGSGLRRSLIIFQFTIAVFLMIATVFILQQLSYIRHKDLGYDKDQVLVLPVAPGMDRPAMQSAIALDPHVRNVGSASGNPVFVQWGDILKANAGGQDRKLNIKAIPADEGFVKTLGIHIIAGSDFQRSDLALMDPSNDYANFRYTFMLNESAVKALGWTPEEAIGKTVFKNMPGTVRAVVKDFHFSSMHESIGPLMLFHDTSYINNIYVKVNAADMGAAIANIQNIWKERVQAYPFEYHFLDDDFNALYKTETRTGQLFGIFAGTAILLACLGLFALAAFTTVQRTKEIGIRKVLGASVTSITSLLSAEFLKLVTIAALIAFPLSWWAVNKWLQEFAYHIPVSAWIFVAALGVALLISLVTVSFQAIRAALANPINSLKSE